jgi:hypothetical protein
MTEERLIEILKRLSKDNNYIILVDGASARIDGDGIWVEGDYDDNRHHYLNTLKIHRVSDTFISISLNGSCYELEITKKLNIGEL